MLKIGHRGASGIAPENTIPAFQSAIEMGCDGIELDVHSTADGQLIVYHDFTLERLTNGTGRVANQTLSQLQELAVKPNHQMPSLEDVLQTIGNKYLYNIELKATEAGPALAHFITAKTKKSGFAYRRFIVSAFDWNALKEFANLNPLIPIGVLTENELDSALIFAKSINAQSIHPHFKLLTRENTIEIQRSGFKVIPWTVNQPADIRYMQNLGVDGIITDFPNRL